MTRLVLTAPVTLPAAAGQPPVVLPKGSVIEATPAQSAAITAAGGSVRAVTSTSMHDQLGESFGASNSTP